MSLLSRASALLALALAMVLAGCGGTNIDASKTDDLVKESVEETRQTKVSSVDCPSGVAVEPKARFSCTVHLSDGSVETATLLIRNKDADLALVNLKPNK